MEMNYGLLMELPGTKLLLIYSNSSNPTKFALWVIKKYSLEVNEKNGNQLFKVMMNLAGGTKLIKILKVIIVLMTVLK
jgi:hypothetical protein